MSIGFDARASRPGREFPILGSDEHAVTPTTLARYFVTGPFTRTSDWPNGQYIRSVHAKEMGSNTTACGIPTASWMTLWEVPFVGAKTQNACPSCRATAG